MMLTLQVCLFGLAGVLLRWGIDAGVESITSHPFPIATLAINVVGSFCIGLIFFHNPPFRLPLMVGLLGGFTTFSGLSIQALELLMTGHVTSGLLYLYGSPTLGLVSAWLGHLCTKTLVT